MTTLNQAIHRHDRDKFSHEDADLIALCVESEVVTGGCRDRPLPVQGDNNGGAGGTGSVASAATATGQRFGTDGSKRPHPESLRYLQVVERVACSAGGTWWWWPHVNGATGASDFSILGLPFDHFVAPLPDVVY